jgi:RNA polymerase sigma-70 factor (ECF subfamily)
MESPEEITKLLRAWKGGDEAALTDLIPRVQRELRRIAHYYMAGERACHPLQTTALINEAYIRLIGWKKSDWESRTQFFAVCSKLMRQVLVDIARSKNAAARRDGARDTTLDEAFEFHPNRSRELLQLDEALNAPAEIDERKTKVIELRFFAGLSVQETAEVLGVSERTVMREWNLAKAWLYREIHLKPKAAIVVTRNPFSCRGVSRGPHRGRQGEID